MGVYADRLVNATDLNLYNKNAQAIANKFFKISGRVAAAPSPQSRPSAARRYTLPAETAAVERREAAG